MVERPRAQAVGGLFESTVGGLADHAVDEEAALLLEGAHRVVEFGVEQLRQDVPAGGQIRIGIVDQTERRQRGPDLGDGRAAAAETQRVLRVVAAWSRHHTAPSVTASAVSASAEIGKTIGSIVADARLNQENARRAWRRELRPDGRQETTSDSSRSRAALPLAPTIRFTGWPSLNRIIVGIDTT